MRKFTLVAFDDIIFGTGTNWYTSASFNDELGSADGLVLHAAPSFVSGTAPTLTCQIEHSANGRNWVNAQTTAEINGLGLTNYIPLEGKLSMFSPVLLNFVRVRISMGGTAPQCRLCIYVTGRVSEIAASAQPAARRIPALARP
jgi:hypothetical protein